MDWKKIREGWRKIEIFGKEHPVLLTIAGLFAAIVVGAISSSISPLIRRFLLELLTLMNLYWVEVLLFVWLIVLTVAVSRIRTAMFYRQTSETKSVQSEVAVSPSELVNNLTLLDGIVLAYCAEQANMTSVSDVLDEVRLASKGTGQRVSSGELLNRLYLLEKHELLHLSMNKQTVFMSEEGRAFYFENKATILTFVNTAIDKMLAERTAQAHG